jgi:DNA polymerase III subunit gamma/tau
VSSTAFNRKYRSQRFEDLVSQVHVATTLRNAVRSARVAHAYLFCGPRGVGKTSAARILAKAVNCANPQDGEPCGVCEPCRSIQEGRAIDVLEADAASNRGIDDVRDLREKIGLAPATLRYKFYILDEAHQITPDAFNALLKTLEEPPPHAVFVLVTTEPQKLPETVVSRCQRLDFRRIAIGDAVKRLGYVCEQEGIMPENGLLELLARSAAGSLRDAEGALDQVVAFAGKQPTVAAARAILGAAGPDAGRQLLRRLVGGDAPGALRLVNDLVDQGADPRQVALDVVDTLRDLLLLRTSERLTDLVDADPEALPELRALAQELAPAQIVELIRAFSPVPGARAGVRPQLPLELSVVEAEELLQTRSSSASARTIAEAPRPAAEPARRVVPPQPLDPVRVPARGNGDQPIEPAPAPVVPPAPAEAPPVAAAPNGEPSGEVSAIKGTGGPLAAEARRRWVEILEACGARNRSVQALLRSGAPIDAQDDTVVLGFPFPFHRERIEEQRNRTVVEDAIGQVLGRKVRVRCAPATKEALTFADPLQSAMEDPIVQAAISMGARVRRVTQESVEETE